MFARVPAIRNQTKYGVLTALLAIVIGGCAPAEPTPDTTTEGDGAPATSGDAVGGQAGDSSANEVLDRMIRAYRKAKTYRDNARVQVVLNYAQGRDADTLKFRVAFARPNRFRIERDYTLVVSDGENIHAQREGFDGQVVVVAAPPKITVPAIYNIDVLQLVMQPGIEGYSTPMELLATDQPLEELRGADFKLIEPAEHDGRQCDRLRFETDAGTLTIWVDRETSLLRRADYPTNSLVQQYAAYGVTDATITIDYAGAELDEPLQEEVFAWKKSDDETLVRYFVQAANPLLGKKTPDFKLKLPDGEEEPSSSLTGQLTVIDFWATWCEPCRNSMPQFAAAHKKYADKDVRFLALSMDLEDVTDEQVKDTLKEIGVEIPWARAATPDPFGVVGAPFGIEAIPAHVVLGKDGRIQYHHIGGGPQAMTKLTEHVDQLLEGKDLASEAIAEYQKQIAMARLDSQVVELPRAKVADATQPKTFKLDELWTAELKGPGNLLVAGSDDEQRVIVIDQFRTLVELDNKGQEVARHDDLLPETAAVTFVRTTTDKENKRYYVVGATGQPQFHVIDQDWKVALSYPEGGSAQIYDVVPVDQDGDGELEMCVGYLGEVGVQSVSLQGERNWRFRSVTNVGDLAVTHADDKGRRQLLLTHAHGTVMQLDHKGQESSTIEIPNFAVTHIVAEDLDGDGKVEMAGIGVDAAGSRLAVGIAGGKLAWSHPLPKGNHETPVEQLLAGRPFADQPAQWVFAAADGSLLFYAADGTLTDSFNTGQKLTGVTLAPLDGKPTLLTASAQGVMAWSIEPKE